MNSRYCYFFVDRSGDKPKRCSRLAVYEDGIGRKVCHQHRKVIDKSSHCHKWRRLSAKERRGEERHG